MYAKHGASVTAIDLTDHALELTRTALVANGVEAKLETANAEQLPFPDEAFDIVMSSGVLHHTPEVFRAIQEAHRVTRRSGTGLITLYRLGIFHHWLVFLIVRAVMRLTKTRHPGPILLLQQVRSKILGVNSMAPTTRWGLLNASTSGGSSSTMRVGLWLLLSATIFRLEWCRSCRGHLGGSRKHSTAGYQRWYSSRWCVGESRESHETICQLRSQQNASERILSAFN